MYPISFDNPNRPKAPSNGQPIAANRNEADATDTRPCSDAAKEFESVSEAQPLSLLVVECRRDDKWRVELCADLSELDGALDMARALRGAADVDEVCLTLEISGVNGRESRREVIRFSPETASCPPQRQAPSTATMGSAVSANSVDLNAIDVLQATVKAPDFCFDDLDFSEFAMPGYSTTPADDAPDEHLHGLRDDPVTDLANTRFCDEDPIDLGHAAAFEHRSRVSARELLSSIYNDDPDLPDDGAAIRVELPHKPHNTAYGPDHSDWLDRTDRRSDIQAIPPHRSGIRDASDDDPDDAIVRLETPLLGRQNGLATKLLVFTGAVALIVLGGALAELLAVDITTAANAGVGAFDTLSAISGDISR